MPNTIISDELAQFISDFQTSGLTTEQYISRVESVVGAKQNAHVQRMVEGLREYNRRQESKENTMSHSQDQCANCMNNVGKSLGRNEYGRPICSSCAGGTTTTAKGATPATPATGDLGDQVVALLDAEKAFLHKPQSKIETREQAVEAIRKFEANKSDVGDQVCAQMLREQFRIYEAL